MLILNTICLNSPISAFSLNSFYNKIPYPLKSSPYIMEIILALAVIAPVIFLGWLSRKTDILTTEHSRGLSQYVYYFALPALFLVKVSSINIPDLDPTIVTGSVLPIFLLVFVLLFLHLMKVIHKDIFILLTLSVIFGSNAFFGVAFFEALRGEAGLNFGIITSSLLGPIEIIGSILLFEYATKKEKGLKFLKKVFINPLIISIAAGVFFSLTELKVDFLFSALKIVGKTAGPVAIFALGIFMYDNFSLHSVKRSLAYSIFRIIALPLSTFIIITWLSPEDSSIREMLLLQAGVPMAISLSVFAKKYNYKIAQISDMVILTSIGSFIVLIAMYFLVI